MLALRLRASSSVTYTGIAFQNKIWASTEVNCADEFVTSEVTHSFEALETGGRKRSGARARAPHRRPPSLAAPNELLVSRACRRLVFQPLEAVGYYRVLVLRKGCRNLVARHANVVASIVRTIVAIWVCACFRQTLGRPVGRPGRTAEAPAYSFQPVQPPPYRFADDRRM